MKFSKADLWLCGLYLAATVCVVTASWIFNIYGSVVRSLLSAEGIRYIVKNALSGYEALAPGSWIFAAAITGLLWKSGAGRVFNVHRLSMKQQSAVGITVFTLLLYIALVLAGIFLPHAVLLGVTGHIERSVLSEGWLYVAGTGCLLTSLVYGVASGAFRNVREIADSLGAGIAFFAPCFITLFLGSQMLACCRYAHFPVLFSDAALQTGPVPLITGSLPFLLKTLELLFRK